MNEERTANQSQHDVTDFELVVDGTNISRDIQMVSMTVNDEVNGVPSAKFILRDGEAAAETFALSDANTFVPGSKVILKLGDDQLKKTVFQGIVVKQCIRAKNSSGSFLIVECKHEAVKMTIGRKNKYFVTQKDSEVFESITGTYGLKGNIEATAVQHKEVVQFHSTDWDFLVTRAESNGQLVLASGEKLDVKAPDTGSASVKTLHFGENLLEIDAEIDARTQWKSVKSFSWDYAGQALFEEETTTAAFTEAGNLSGSKLSEVIDLEHFEIRHSGQVVPEELKAWAKATMLKSRMAKIRGRAKIKGDAAVKPGVMVKLEGCGSRFNGKVYVTGVRHEVSSGSWFMQVQFGLSPEWFYENRPHVAPPAGGGITPPIHGLQIGVVVQLESDPDGEDRILVKLPVLDHSAKGIWARVCTLDAGNDRGTFFRPEISDEVIVGFLNDDPRDAVVLGMLNSSAKPAPVKAKDDNHIKGLQTRSKMKFMFDDDKKIITLETPAGNIFVMSEDEKSISLTDQNGNTIKMDPDGIVIKSIKDIKIESAQNMDAKAGQNLKMEGTMNAELKAGTQLTSKGGASAEFSSGGATQLKGAIVKIN